MQQVLSSQASVSAGCDGRIKALRIKNEEADWKMIARYQEKIDELQRTVEADEDVAYVSNCGHQSLASLAPPQTRPPALSIAYWTHFTASVLDLMRDLKLNRDRDLPGAARLERVRRRWLLSLLLSEEDFGFRVLAFCGNTPEGVRACVRNNLLPSLGLVEVQDHKWDLHYAAV